MARSELGVSCNDPEPQGEAVGQMAGAAPNRGSARERGVEGSGRNSEQEEAGWFSLISLMAVGSDEGSAGPATKSTKRWELGLKTNPKSSSQKRREILHRGGGPFILQVALRGHSFLSALMRRTRAACALFMNADFLPYFHQ